MKTHNGQTLLEYVILAGIVAAVLVAMGPMLKRSVQSIVKITADQLAPQNESEQTVEDETSSYLVNAFTARRVRTDKRLFEQFNAKSYVYDDTISTLSNSHYNLGFTNRRD